ncbi:hypothetical protein B0H14DRAFT_3888631 [Mycena olivaceomarginata]|nr:hypothetical protein B0H14DRAFT_3888631 [Mycena olivaceomarginata]
MTTSSPKLKQSQKTKKASEQRRKRRQALQQYAERNAETLREKAKERMRRLRAAQAAQNKSSDRSLADFDYRERKRRQKYIENYGGRSYHQFYYPLLEFFGEGNLAGVTIIDETKHRRSKKFKLEITEEYEDAKRRFQLGKKPKHFFYLVREPLAGEKAAIYSLKSAAENALPRTGSFEIVRCKTIAQAVYEWRRWCQDTHLTCDLTYLANIHQTPQHRSAPPPTPADSAVYVPGSESESEEVPRATHPTHPTRRWVREVTPDSGGYCVLPDAERPIILPIDNKAAKKLGIGMDGIKAEHEGIGADGVKVEAGSGTVRIKRKGGTMRVKRAGGAVGVNREVEGGMDHEGDGTRLEAGATPAIRTSVLLLLRSGLRILGHLLADYSLSIFAVLSALSDGQGSNGASSASGNSYTGPFFPNSRHLVVVGGAFASYNSIVTVPPDYPRLPLGSIDIRIEIRLDTTNISVPGMYTKSAVQAACRARPEIASKQNTTRGEAPFSGCTRRESNVPARR